MTDRRALPGTGDDIPRIVREAAQEQTLGSALRSAPEALGVHAFWLVLSVAVGVPAAGYAVYGLLAWISDRTEPSRLIVVGIAALLAVGAGLGFRDHVRVLRLRPAVHLFEGGLVYVQGNTCEVISWDDLALWQPSGVQRATVVVTYRLYLRRTDGYELLIGEDARDKSETGAKNVITLNQGRAFGQAVIRQFVDNRATGYPGWAELRTGGTLSYGHVSLSRAGLHFWDGTTLPFGQIVWVGVENDNLAVRSVPGGKIHPLPIAAADIPHVTDLTTNANRLATLAGHGGGLS